MFIYATIALYNPEKEKLIRNINAIAPQVEKVILIDNASQNQEMIEATCSLFENIYLMKNSDNKGIAAALNQGVAFAAMQGAEWVITLDQDSECSPIMANEYKKYIMTKNIGILCPIEIDRNYFKNLQIGYELQEVDKCITSGSMIRVNVWEEIGKFQEELFIDFVDNDFCMRVKLGGYKICRVNTVVMLQEIGNAKGNYTFLWKKPYVCNHSALRKYYIFRNWHYYINRYKHGISKYMEKYKMLKFFFKTLMYEDRKLEKAKAMFRGYKDTKKLEIEIYMNTRNSIEGA